MPAKAKSDAQSSYAVHDYVRVDLDFNSESASIGLAWLACAVASFEGRTFRISNYIRHPSLLAPRMRGKASASVE